MNPRINLKLCKLRNRGENPTNSFITLMIFISVTSFTGLLPLSNDYNTHTEQRGNYSELINYEGFFLTDGFNLFATKHQEQIYQKSYACLSFDVKFETCINAFSLMSTPMKCSDES